LRPYGRGTADGREIHGYQKCAKRTVEKRRARVAEGRISAADAQRNREFRNAFDQLPHDFEVRPEFFGPDTVFFAFACEVRRSASIAWDLADSQQQWRAAWPLTRSLFELATDMHGFVELSRSERDGSDQRRPWLGSWTGVGCRIIAHNAVVEDFFAQEHARAANLAPAAVAAGSEYIEEVAQMWSTVSPSSVSIDILRNLYVDAHRLLTKTDGTLRNPGHWYGSRKDLLEAVGDPLVPVSTNYLYYSVMSKLTHGYPWIPSWPDVTRQQLAYPCDAAPVDTEDPRAVIVGCVKHALDLWQSLFRR
jgi:hypothetical protein